MGNRVELTQEEIEELMNITEGNTIENNPNGGMLSQMISNMSDNEVRSLVYETIEKPTDDMDKNLEILKNFFSKVQDIINAIDAGFDFESYRITNGFKRHFFKKADEFKVLEPGFYGDRTIETTIPTTLTFLGLTFIWNAMDLEFDRYGQC